MKDAASRYESRFPETGIGEAQKQERGERLAVREDRRASRRRSIVVPELPWKKETKP